MLQRLKVFHYVTLAVYYTTAAAGLVPVSYDPHTFKTRHPNGLKIYWILTSLLRIFLGPQSYIFVFIDMNMWNIKLIASSVVGAGLCLSYTINLLSTMYYHTYASTVFSVYDALVDNVERNLLRYLKKKGMLFLLLMCTSGFWDISALICTFLLRGAGAEANFITYGLWLIRIEVVAFNIFTLLLYTGFMFSIIVTLQVFNEDVVMAFDKLNGPCPAVKEKSLPNHEFLLRRLIYKYKLITGACNAIHNSFKVPILLALLYVYIDVLGGSFASYYIQVHHKNLGDDSLSDLQNLLVVFAIAETVHMYLIFYSSSNVRKELLRTREILLSHRYIGTDTRVMRRIEIFTFTVKTTTYDAIFCGLFQTALSDFYNVFKDIFMTFIVLIQFDDGNTFLSRYKLSDVFGNVTQDDVLTTSRIMAIIEGF